ncbi:MAG: hypothetical protein AVDCRST_MAG38-1279 [uncultured Solirubrobacteraceae bacterium]|uniref:VanZ-like domain-containing protein n=1 Tax=uncultured Solirubrobacteraceae bacterium TaxID=1162706 RepID=A0A6J4RD78_9ACTN|nr:MAG: hypothetical protein AVDCRST_MAG38-1279 [uncultured Solirubrobacteraceae bacterium]
MVGLAGLASRFLPPLLLMGAIFFLSAQPGLNSGLGVWDTVLRKLAHMIEFGLLWLLWWRALGYGSPLPAIAIALAYAASDELHQTFVPDRAGSPVDWAIDAAGVGLAGAAVALWSRLAPERAPRFGAPRDSAPV